MKYYSFSRIMCESTISPSLEIPCQGKALEAAENKANAQAKRTQESAAICGGVALINQSEREAVHQAWQLFSRPHSALPNRDTLLI